MSFEDFWQVWLKTEPRRKVDNRGGALKKYNKALEKDGATHDEIMAGLKAFKETWDPNCDVLYMPQAQTWLNKQMYRDEYPVLATNSLNGESRIDRANIHRDPISGKMVATVDGSNYSFQDALRMRGMYQNCMLDEEDTALCKKVMEAWDID